MSGLSIVVKAHDETFLYNINQGETLESVIKRLEEIHRIPRQIQKVYVMCDNAESSDLNYAPLPASDVAKYRVDAEFTLAKLKWLNQACSQSDAIIYQLMPTLSTIVTRNRIVEFVKKTLSKCLGSRTFCIGASMNNTYLPNETIELTPFLCKGQEDKWFLRVNEALCMAAISGTMDKDLELHSVSFDCKQGKVTLKINNHQVHIVHNELGALYFAAFIESANKQVAIQCLLKRSIVLIKSWCAYDSSQFLPATSDKTCIQKVFQSSLLISVMTLHVFSVFGETIDHPLKALALFLYYYTGLDWENTIINVSNVLSTSTFQSILPHTYTNDSVTDYSNSKYKLMIEELSIQYRRRYDHTVMASQKIRFADDANVEYTEADGGFEFLNPDQVATSTIDDQHASINFPVSFMNIMHPMKADTNLTSNISRGELEEIRSVFRQGLQSLVESIELSKTIPSEKYKSVDVGNGLTVDIGSFFLFRWMSRSKDEATRAHLKAKETVPVQDYEFKKTIFHCEGGDECEEIMRHAELIMGSKITPDAVANLIVHIVEQAGPHPIGEIGKLLQESTGNPNLSRVLKAQFRGLKKLIEGYPHMLRLGGDHSFNPHVYLAESAVEVSNGVKSVSTSDLLKEPSGCGVNYNSEPGFSSKSLSNPALNKLPVENIPIMSRLADNGPSKVESWMNPSGPKRNSQVYAKFGLIGDQQSQQFVHGNSLLKNRANYGSEPPLHPNTAISRMNYGMDSMNNRRPLVPNSRPNMNELNMVHQQQQLQFQQPKPKVSPVTTTTKQRLNPQAQISPGWIQQQQGGYHDYSSQQYSGKNLDYLRSSNSNHSQLGWESDGYHQSDKIQNNTGGLGSNSFLRNDRPWNDHEMTKYPPGSRGDLNTNIGNPGYQQRSLHSTYNGQPVFHDEDFNTIRKKATSPSVHSGNSNISGLSPYDPILSVFGGSEGKSVMGDNDSVLSGFSTDFSLYDNTSSNTYDPMEQSLLRNSGSSPYRFASEKGANDFGGSSVQEENKRQVSREFTQQPTFPGLGVNPSNNTYSNYFKNYNM